MRRPRGLVCLVVASIWVAATVPCAVSEAAIRIRPNGSSIDLTLMGFAVFQTDLSRDLERFFDAGDGLPAEFTNRQIANVQLEGGVRDGVEVKARVHYDRENLRDLRYLVELAGEQNRVAFGELDGAFRETLFTRYDTPFYGLAGTAVVGPVKAEAFTTSRQGNFRVDRLRGTNLSGPYILSASPVLEGSERVAVEVRDRRDQERILSSDLRLRQSDYTIDYPMGTVQFNEPIEAETFDGDPVVVVIEYQFEARSSATVDYLSGVRATVSPVAGVDLGATFVRSSSGGDSALADGIIGVDQQIAFGRWLRVDNEMAGPRGNLLDRDRGAWRLGVGVRPFENLELSARFRRVGQAFETTANPTLDSDLDRQSLDLDLSFLPRPEHRLTASYGDRSNDVSRDPAVEQTRTRSWAAGWEGRMAGWPRLRSRFERRLTDSPGSVGAVTARLDSWTLDLEDSLGTWPGLGAASVRAQYRLEDADEARDEGSGSRRGHLLRVRLDTQPKPKFNLFIEGRGSISRGTGSVLEDTLTNELLLGGRYELPRRLAVGGSLRNRASRNRTVEASDSRRTTAIFEVSYEPSDRLRGLLKYEWALTAAESTDETRTRNVYGQLAVRPRDGFDLSLGYRLDDQSQQFGGIDGRENGEYFVTVTYERGERFTLFGRGERERSSERLPPFEATESVRTTWLAGVSYDLDDAWGILAELKAEEFTGAVTTDRRLVILEVSRAVSRYLRLAGGVEVAVRETGDVSLLDGERYYVKLIGRL